MKATTGSSSDCDIDSENGPWIASGIDLPVAEPPLSDVGRSWATSRAWMIAAIAALPRTAPTWRVVL